MLLCGDLVPSLLRNLETIGAIPCKMQVGIAAIFTLGDTAPYASDAVVADDLAICEHHRFLTGLFTCLGERLVKQSVAPLT